MASSIYMHYSTKFEFSSCAGEGAIFIASEVPIELLLPPLVNFRDDNFFCKRTDWCRGLAACNCGL